MLPGLILPREVVLSQSSQNPLLAGTQCFGDSNSLENLRVSGGVGMWLSVEPRKTPEGFEFFYATSSKPDFGFAH